MHQRTTTDYVVLGVLMPGERHAYEIMRLLGSALEGACRMSTSQLYVLLKRMEVEEVVLSRAEEQKSRPSKRVFTATPLGIQAFDKWLKSPVKHVRDIRMEFLCKLFFFKKLALSGASELDAAQIHLLESISERLAGKDPTSEDTFKLPPNRFKTKQIDCMLRWLKEDASVFAAGCST